MVVLNVHIFRMVGRKQDSILRKEAKDKFYKWVSLMNITLSMTKKMVILRR